MNGAVVAVLMGGSAASAAGPTPHGHGSGVGPVLVFALVLLVPVALGLVAGRLRACRPVVWWLVFGWPLVVWRVAFSWRPLCESARLSIPAKRLGRFAVTGGHLVSGEAVRMVAPRRSSLRLTRCGLVVRVRMHDGQVPLDWRRAAEAIGHAWRVFDVRVSSSSPGYVLLEARAFDPLQHVDQVAVSLPRPRPPERTSPPFRPTKPPDKKEKGETATHELGGLGALVPVGRLTATVGVREDARPWVLDFTDRPHWLVTGATRSGKSTLLTALVRELAPLPVALVGVDAKGGVELGVYERRFSALACTRGEASAVLGAVLELVPVRAALCRSAGARNLGEISAELRPPPIVVLVDEVAELLLASDRDGKAQAARNVECLSRIGALGAAFGVHLVVAGQRLGSELGSLVVNVRANLAGRICHRVADSSSAEMTLHGVGQDAVDAALAISDGMRGVAVVGGDDGSWIRARSFLVPIAEAASVAERFAHLTVPLPDVTAALNTWRSAHGNGDVWSGPAGGEG